MQKRLNLELGLIRLDQIKRMCFCASCCERILPNYLAFSLIEEWGNYQRLRDVLDEIWIGLYDPSRLSGLRNISLNELVKLGPDTEDFATLFASLAGDAVSAIIYTIEACLKPEDNSAKTKIVSDLVFDSLFEYLATVNDPNIKAHIEIDNYEKEIFSYPLMVSEIENQGRDIEYLTNISTLSKDEILALKIASANHGVQPIKRGLVKARVS